MTGPSTVEHDLVLGVDRLVKGFSRGLPPRRRQIGVLAGARLDVHGGELAGLVGENGSGKSTLLQLVVGLLQPDDGRIEPTGRLGYRPQVPLL